MRVLTRTEMNEFEKTYNFLNYYIGFAAHMAKKVEQIKFDEKMANAEIIRFVNSFKNIYKIDESNLNLSSHNELQKINLLFNECTSNHKKIVMDRLINYCFNNRVQPYRLRMIGFKNYTIAKDVTPVVVEYETAA